MTCLRPTTRRLAPVLAGFVLAALTGFSAFADETLVKISNFAFTPQNLAVKPGTTVTFENDDDIPHLVIATDGSFRSKALDTGDKYTFVFAKAGDFSYFCGLHPHMQGKIVVSR
jgi:plastocyanin